MFLLNTRHTLALCVASIPLALAANAVFASSGPAQSGLFAPADSAMTAALNPAGMTRLERPDWVAQGLVFVSNSTFEFR